MFEITCPWCGKRAQTEFSYEGDATLERPDGGTEMRPAGGTVMRPEGGTVTRPDGGDEKAFFDYVYLRDNPRGWHDELWQHTAGCRRFLKVRRHVTTHEIAGSAKPGEDLPPVEENAR